MSLEQLKKDIHEKNFKKVYYICGNELYLKRFYLNSLKSAAFSEDIEDNTARYNESSPADFTKMNGRKLSVEDFTEQYEALPVMSTRKMIVIHDPPLNSPVIDFLIKNPKRLESDTILIIFAEEEKYDQRTKDYKAFISFVQCNGLTVCVDPLDEKTLKRWVAQSFRKKDREISTDAVNYLVDNTDNNMYMLQNEIDKLSAFTHGKNDIKIKDIDAICTKTVDAKIYELTDAVLSKNIPAALDISNKLIEMGTNSNIILGAIFNSISGLYKICILKNEGLKSSEIAKKTGMKEFIVKKNLEKLSFIPYNKIRAVIEACAESDISAKTSQTESEILITELICKCASLLK